MRIASFAASAAIAAVLVATSSVALAAGKSAAPNYTLTSTTYTQDFDSLASSGTANTALPQGFQIVELGGGNAADGRYAAGSGTNNAGNIYSFGNSSDRALGSIGSGTVAPNYFGGVFTNGLGGTIASIAFAYTGEQWRA
ncbi:PEP-CTERM sorting domain-containing protein, partial [Lactobacillus kullabergensis]|nr:PEP-CTERM sorting domain-containing protein [Lactobacillus kullabergensis]